MGADVGTFQVADEPMNGYVYTLPFKSYKVMKNIETVSHITSLSHLWRI